jgi:hypothetical protein
MVMRRPLGSLLPALVSALLLVALPAAGLAGCGDDSGSAADTPSADHLDYRLVDTITVTGAGGSVSEAGVPLSDDTVVQQFLAQFTSDDLPQQLQDKIAATDVPDGDQLYGAVIAVGCDSPDHVDVAAKDDGVAVTAVQVPSPRPECFAPMTTVALVLVDR